jgi:hypothetical protein
MTRKVIEAYGRISIENIPDQTFKLWLNSTGFVLDILNSGWSVNFGKKVNL